MNIILIKKWTAHASLSSFSSTILISKSKLEKIDHFSSAEICVGELTLRSMQLHSARKDSSGVISSTEFLLIWLTITPNKHCSVHMATDTDMTTTVMDMVTQKMITLMVTLPTTTLTAIQPTHIVKMNHTATKVTTDEATKTKIKKLFKNEVESYS